MPIQTHSLAWEWDQSPLFICNLSFVLLLLHIRFKYIVWSCLLILIRYTHIAPDTDIVLAFILRAKSKITFLPKCHQRLYTVSCERPSHLALCVGRQNTTETVKANFKVGKIPSQGCWGRFFCCHEKQGPLSLCLKDSVINIFIYTSKMMNSDCTFSAPQLMGLEE